MGWIPLFVYLLRGRNYMRRQHCRVLVCVMWAVKLTQPGHPSEVDSTSTSERQRVKRHTMLAHHTTVFLQCKMVSVWAMWKLGSVNDFTFVLKCLLLQILTDILQAIDHHNTVYISYVENWFPNHRQFILFKLDEIWQPQQCQLSLQNCHDEFVVVVSALETQTLGMMILSVFANRLQSRLSLTHHANKSSRWAD